MAQRTGLEPATPGVTGRYSNRLNYRCIALFYITTTSTWWALTDSNRRPAACKAAALPTELNALSEDKQSTALPERKIKAITTLQS